MKTKYCLCSRQATLCFEQNPNGNHVCICTFGSDPYSCNSKKHTCICKLQTKNNQVKKKTDDFNLGNDQCFICDDNNSDYDTDSDSDITKGVCTTKICRSDVHECVCSLKNPSKCKSTVHDCSCQKHGTLYCKEEYRHNCVCLRKEQRENGLKYENFVDPTYSCLAERHQYCRCVVFRNSPYKISLCQLGVHECICPFDGCLSGEHKCVCISEGPEKCKVFGYYAERLTNKHICSCIKHGPSSCRKNGYHKCICNKFSFTKCKSQDHICYICKKESNQVKYINTINYVDIITCDKCNYALKCTQKSFVKKQKKIFFPSRIILKAETIEHREIIFSVSQVFISSFIGLIKILFNNNIPFDLIEKIFLLIYPNKRLVGHLIYLVDPKLSKKKIKKIK